ncbi:elongation factor P hydroxylase [Dasania marina]|uniref:elongation factor P hydroxylase n=1 Tax=Dasania marina TaxID=471499 RepID=UPI00037DEC23|nr:elongation factor P hydroxylase [Dasania marina]
MLAELIELFDRCFFQSCNTRLVKGGVEPLYSPADKCCDYHRIIFAHGFFSSALHEIAHWCLAGEQRRKQIDYGYWYAEDGRSAQQQTIFEAVEVKPQAIEWMFSVASAQKFSLSVDNLNGEYTDPLPFKQAVLAQVKKYCEQGLPQRAALFQQQLIVHFNPAYQLSADHFSLDRL